MKKKSARTVLLVLGLLFVAVAIAAQIHVLVKGPEIIFNSLISVSSVVNIVALAFAGVYILSGFKKSSATLYKSFLALFTFASLFAVVDLAVTLSGKSSELLLFKVVAYGLLNVLLFAKDLGKKNSYILSYSVLGLTVLLLVTAVVKTVIFAESPELYIKVSFLRWFSHFMMSVALVGSVHLKYLDKNERNTD